MYAMIDNCLQTLGLCTIRKSMQYKSLLYEEKNNFSAARNYHLNQQMQLIQHYTTNNCPPTQQTKPTQQKHRTINNN